MRQQTGHIKKWEQDKGWGFIKTDDGGNDVFLFFKHFKDRGTHNLKWGDRVSFESVKTPKGVQARKVKLIQIGFDNWSEFIGDVPHKGDDDE